MGAPQRGIIHSVFNAAANIVFPDDFVLSLNATPSSSGADALRLYPPRSPIDRSIPRMPNGLQLSAVPGTYPFTAFRAGMPVLFGAQRLHIEAISCSLDLSLCTQWNPHIERPAVVDIAIIRKNRERLDNYIESDSRAYTGRFLQEKGQNVHNMAQFFCGRGIGLTPTGDDILAGWMAAGWLLYGSMPGFLDACQQIVEVAKRQTHLLSQCWLAYAAGGNVAQPICILLDALARDDEPKLLLAAEGVLAMGATSGHDVIQGMLLMLNEI